VGYNSIRIDIDPLVGEAEVTEVYNMGIRFDGEEVDSGSRRGSVRHDEVSRSN
jgi:hypothetical protein